MNQFQLKKDYKHAQDIANMNEGLIHLVFDNKGESKGFAGNLNIEIVHLNSLNSVNFLSDIIRINTIRNGSREAVDIEYTDVYCLIVHKPDGYGKLKTIDSIWYNEFPTSVKHSIGIKYGTGIRSTHDNTKS
tara:strand:- start:8855 stop:9250 length:396 start_codon:yes stop_codon:yes gene_type:complete